MSAAPMMILLLALASLGGLPFHASARAESKPKEIESPVWRIDLRQFGYAAPYQRAVAGMPFSKRTSWLTFASDKRIALLFPSYEGNPDRFAAVPFRLHLLLLDAPSGHMIATRAWPVVSGLVDLRTTEDSNILVQSGTHIDLFSSTLHEIRSLDLAAKRDREPQDWSMLVSSTGHSFFLQSESEGPRSLKMIDPATLNELGSWDDTRGAEAATDHLLASLQNRELYVRSLDSPWRRIHTAAACGQKWNSNGSHMRFLTDDTLLVAGCTSLTVLKTDGEVVFEDNVSKNNCVYPEAAASADGSRFGISIGKLTGVNIRVLDLGRYWAPQRLVVYDTKGHQAVGKIRLGWRTGFALSRDGSTLVYGDDGILQLFRLPRAAAIH